MSTWYCITIIIITITIIFRMVDHISSMNLPLFSPVNLFPRNRKSS